MILDFVIIWGEEVLFSCILLIVVFILDIFLFYDFVECYFLVVVRRIRNIFFGLFKGKFC